MPTLLHVFGSELTSQRRRTPLGSSRSPGSGRLPGGSASSESLPPAAGRSGPSTTCREGKVRARGTATLPSARHPSQPGPPSSPGHRRCDCTHFTDYQPEARRGRSHVPKVTHGGRQELCLVPAFCLLSTNLCHHTRQTHGASHVALVVKKPPANAGDARVSGLIPGLGRSPGGGHGNPLQYSCLENPIDRA